MVTTHPVCTQQEWDEARKQLLLQEKQLTQLREQIAERRRALPWVRVQRDYTFQGPDGARSLRELFGDKSQLLVYHFMFAPEWEAGCTSCSFWAENFDRNLVHLAHRDVSLVAISRAPVEKLSAYARRMGWSFPWFSSGDSSFNYDFAVSFDEQQRASEGNYNFGTQSVRGSDMPGFSVFSKDAAGAVFRTYSCYSRGIDMMNATHQFLDLVPGGRAERVNGVARLKRRDEYDQANGERAADASRSQTCGRA
jgi:predicted dithiol-disulfide oxidoreductase (DUF899 family)